MEPANKDRAPVNAATPSELGAVNAAAEDAVFQQFNTTIKGLNEKEAALRLTKYGPNETARKKRIPIPLQILSKFLNPLVVVLVIIGAFSLFFGEKISALLVLFMIFISVFLSFIQEHRSGREVEKLSEMVRLECLVHRGGKTREIKINQIVPGDIVELSAGDMVPADLRIIYSKDLFVSQASLTGEAFPVEKFSQSAEPKASAPSKMSAIAFMGSSVVSGTALGVVARTGLATQFGELSRKLAAIRVETSFDKGVKSFTWLMISAMLILVVIIFGVNAVFKGNPLEAFLFSLAVAVGLTPEMLPMLIAVNLSKGAAVMSKNDVIVKHLNSIQNLGAMDVICTDKTGTLTEDRIVLEKYYDVVRKESDDVLRLACINSIYQTGLKNILDKAILKHEKILTKQHKKIDEIPFDFSRKIMSVIVQEADGAHVLISKGAPEEIYKRCTHYELDGEIFEMEDLIMSDVKDEYDRLSAEGFRVLAVAYKDTPNTQHVYSKNDEKGLVLKGYLVFLDPPKATAMAAIRSLKKLGVDFKVVTGDNEMVTRKICSEVGLDVKGLITGDAIEGVSDKELESMAVANTVFARFSPLQKERIIRALHAADHVVGYLGDGINDAPALKASDVGISVNNAVDIAKESADLILLKKSLMVLKEGVMQGRKTFCNIIKYIKMSSSSNFGNMLSMTGASVFLPFLPMLPIQILLNNFLYDLSQIAIPTDNVDKEYIEKPRPWDIRSIKRFMLIFGPISSIFDFVTFGMLLFIFHASTPYFRTGWFLESLCTQTLVIYVIRTGKIPLVQSRPSAYLLFSSLLIVGFGLFIAHSTLASPFGFVPVHGSFLVALTLIVVSYLILTQFAKMWFVKKFGY